MLVSTKAGRNVVKTKTYRAKVGMLDFGALLHSSYLSFSMEVVARKELTDRAMAKLEENMTHPE